MTRKHFEMIAGQLKANKARSTDKAAADILSYEMATKLQDTNPNFNRVRFLKACGAED